MKIHNDPVMLSYFKYVPTTLADVQRSFLIYNNLLTDRRQNFTGVRLEYHLIINLNSKEKNPFTSNFLIVYTYLIKKTLQSLL